MVKPMAVCKVLTMLKELRLRLYSLTPDSVRILTFFMVIDALSLIQSICCVKYIGVCMHEFIWDGKKWFCTVQIIFFERVIRGKIKRELYFVSPRERPWRQRVFWRKPLVIARATCVFSHAFKKEHRDWRIKDASCSVYPWAHSVTSRSFSGWDKV